MQVNNITPNYQIRRNSTNNVKKNATPSFGGAVPEPVVNGLSNFYGKVANNKGFSNFIKNFSKSPRTFTHLLVAESFLLSGFYMINTLRSKKIEKEQKPQMIINDAMVLGISTAGAYLVEDKITDKVKQWSEKYFTKHSDFYMDCGKEAAEKSKEAILDKIGKESADDIATSLSDHIKSIRGNKTFQKAAEECDTIISSVKTAITENANDLTKAKEVVGEKITDVCKAVAARAEADKTFSGINKLKVLVIFGIIYRYLGPVVVTPIANKISSKFFEGKKDKAEKTQA